MGEETVSHTARKHRAALLQWSLSNMGEETASDPDPQGSAALPFNGASPTWERKRGRGRGAVGTVSPSMEPLQHGRGNP